MWKRSGLLKIALFFGTMSSEVGAQNVVACVTCVLLWAYCIFRKTQTVVSCIWHGPGITGYWHKIILNFLSCRILKYSLLLCKPCQQLSRSHLFLFHCQQLHHIVYFPWVEAVNQKQYYVFDASIKTLFCIFSYLSL